MIATGVIDPHTMSHKHNAADRHHICKMKFEVTNWREYEAGSRRRGDQSCYSDLAIEVTLTLGMAFGSPPLQIEGLLSPVFRLMGLELPVPGHTTLSPRARTWSMAD